MCPVLEKKLLLINHFFTEKKYLYKIGAHVSGFHYRELVVEDAAQYTAFN